MHFKDLFTPADVRQADHHLAIESTRTQQRGIKDVGTVSGGNYNDTFIAIEAIHFHQQLVQCLFAFVMASTYTGAAITTHGIDFIDEDDAGRLLLGLDKHVTHA